MAPVVVFGLGVGLSGCSSCQGCGAEKEPVEDTRPTDVRDTDVEDEPLAEAIDEAKQKAVDRALARSDQARYIAGNVAAQQEDEESDEPRVDRTPETIPTDPQGKLSKSELEEVFRKHSGQTRQCYERQLKMNPSLAGRVIVAITIDTDGTVARVRAQPDSLQNDQVNSCLEDRIREWKFPEPDGGAARVRKPFSFSPKQN